MRDKRTGEQVAVKFIERGDKVRRRAPPPPLVAAIAPRRRLYH